MSEEDILNEIFDKRWVASSGNKYLVKFCDLCDVWMISHVKCSGSTCNAHSCSECEKDFGEFNNYKVSVLNYLTDAEIQIWEKCLAIKKLIGETIVDGEKSIDFKKLNGEDKLSQVQREIFAKELDVGKVNKYDYQYAKNL